MSIDLVVKTKRVKDGKLTKFSCDVGYMDTKFFANVHRASSKKEYGYVLQVSVVSPDTHRILQAGGKRYNDFLKKLDNKLDAAKVLIENTDPDTPEFEKAQKAVALLEFKKEKLRMGKPLEELNATGSSYLKSDDEKIIKKEIEKLVMRLYGDYQEDIFKAFKRTISASDLHARTSYDMYQNDFFASLPATTSKVLQGKKNTLKHLCNDLNAVPISALSESEMNRVFIGLKGDAAGKMKLVEKFFDYVGENGGYVGINPVTRFLGRKLLKGKKGAALKLYKRQSSHLSVKAEQRLHAYLTQHILDDDLALAIALVKGFKMEMDRILTITWQDICIEGDEVRIRDYKPNYTGGTHNYTRPPTRETADLLIERYNHLCQDQGKTKLKKLLIVPACGKTMKEKKAALTGYFRRVLGSVAVTQEDFAKAIDPENPKASGGAGYALLCKHYVYTLQEKCGIIANSGLGCYVMSMRIYDTTTDYYLCLSDDSGNHHLQVVMRRAQLDSTERVDVPPITEIESNTAYHDFLVRAVGHESLNAVSSKKQIFIPAGSMVAIRSKYGVRGFLKFSNTPKSTTTGSYQTLY